jgi:hypothetical protein
MTEDFGCAYGAPVSSPASEAPGVERHITRNPRGPET